MHAPFSLPHTTFKRHSLHPDFNFFTMETAWKILRVLIFLGLFQDGVLCNTIGSLSDKTAFSKIGKVSRVKDLENRRNSSHFSQSYFSLVNHEKDQTMIQLHSLTGSYVERFAFQVLDIEKTLKWEIWGSIGQPCRDRNSWKSLVEGSKSSLFADEMVISEIPEEQKELFNCYTLGVNGHHQLVIRRPSGKGRSAF